MRLIECSKNIYYKYPTLSIIIAIVLLALSLRAFFLEPFKIPSGSMIPNLKIGDHIFVNKFVYGFRIPFTLKALNYFRNPKRGEIFIFNFPNDTSKDYVKRVLALPGDKVVIDDMDIKVNGVPIKREGPLTDKNDLKILEDIPYADDYNLYKETSLDGYTYYVIYKKSRLFGFSDCNYCFDKNFEPIVVPKDMYFAIGDNRDNSSDSRVWGFVPREYIKGRALFTWLSLNSDKPLFWIIPSIRWERFGRLIK